MNSFSRLRAARARGSRGAASVEAAIVFPVLLLITFGIIEYGLVFKTTLTMSAATRSGARTGSAEPRQQQYFSDTAAAIRANLLNGVPSNEIKYLTIYKADPSTGNVTGGQGFETCTTFCYRFTWNTGSNNWDCTCGGAAPTYNFAGAPNWLYSSQAACGDAAHTDYLGIYIRVVHNYITGMFGNVITLTDTAVMRLEPVPITGGQACS